MRTLALYHGRLMAIITDITRKCECGCGESLAGRPEGTKFDKGSCRTRAFREKRKPTLEQFLPAPEPEPTELFEGVRECVCVKHNRKYIQSLLPIKVAGRAGQWAGVCVLCELEELNGPELQRAVLAQADQIEKFVAAEMAKLELSGEFKKIIDEAYEAESVDLRQQLEIQKRIEWEAAFRNRRIVEIRTARLEQIKAASPRHRGL